MTSERKLLVDCPDCRASVEARIEHEVYWEGDEPWEYPTQVSFVTCLRCKRPLVVGDEHYGYNGDEEVRSGTFRLWPPPDKQLSLSVPAPIREAFREAQTCFRAKAYVAAAVMCRKVMESVTHVQGAKSRNLMGALGELRDASVIDPGIFEWADALRIVGNDAAHGVDVRISEDEARDVLDFTEAIIDYLFVYRERFEAFRSRSATSGNRREPEGEGVESANTIET